MGNDVNKLSNEVNKLDNNANKSDKVLGKVLQDCKAVKFGDFTLASGKKSRYYVDVKMAVTKPKILKLISSCIVEEIEKRLENREIIVDYIACVELGAVPLGTAVSLDTGIPLVIVRKEQKDHGIQKRIVGEFEQKKFALLVEDVTTTGGSVISAVKALRNEGLVVSVVISVVDRDQGAQAALEEEGLILISLVKAKTLLEDYEIAQSLERKL